ncbi:MAG: HAD-IC family P-type ATPase, partial [Candidatus Helarchaeota archaeon]
NTPFYKLTKDEIFEIFNSSENGLTEAQVEINKKKYGLNEIPRKRGSLIKAILPQVFDYVIIILLICAIILLIFALIDENVSMSNSILIFGVVILNSIFVFTQMFRAEKSLKKLQELTAHKALVLRDGKKVEVFAKELVPGDIVYFQMGDYIPADIRVIESSNLYTDESLLTGESAPVEKISQPIEIKEPEIYNLHNIIFNGTMVVKGNGKGIVIGIGLDTYLGKLASGIKEISIKEVPLQRKMKQLGRALGL